MKYFIGCSGFYYNEWAGTFYPEGLPKKKWLHFYAEHFNALEVNASFYGIPSQKSLNNWYDETPEDFLFSLKAPKQITHIKRFTCCENELNEFYKRMEDGLKDKLGCLLFQLPPSFSYSAENLEKIVTALNDDFKNVVEFRHDTWWRKDVFDTLGEKKIIFCGEDYPGNIPQDVVVNTDDVYYRFHGNPILYKSLYAPEKLMHIAASIKQSGKDAFVFFNNTWGGAALKNAEEMKAILK